MKLSALFSLSLLLPRACFAQYPYLQQRASIASDGMAVLSGIRKGNGVVLAGDQMSLWVTDAAGSLHVFDAQGSLQRLATFQAPPVENLRTEGRSSVAIYENTAIYAVLDVHPDGKVSR